MYFRPAIVLWTVIQLSLSMCILYTSNKTDKMRIDKVEWIICSHCGKPKWHSFKPSLSWTKIADPGILFLRKRYQSTDTIYFIHILLELYRSVFIETPCIDPDSYYYMRTFSLTNWALDHIKMWSGTITLD